MMPPRSQEEMDTSMRFMSYQRGWEHRAAGRAKDPKFDAAQNKMLCAAYELGYEAAGVLKNAALSAYATEIGYDMQAAILR
jgi:hypothetical protein